MPVRPESDALSQFALRHVVATPSASSVAAPGAGRTSSQRSDPTPLVSRRQAEERDAGSQFVPKKTSILPPRLRNALDRVTAKKERKAVDEMSLDEVETLLRNQKMLTGRGTRALQKRREEALRDGTSGPTSPSLLKKAMEKLNDMSPHGLGITQTTISPHPFRSVTASASPKMISTVRGDGQDAPVIPKPLAVQMTAPSAAPERAAKAMPAMLKDMDHPARLDGVVTHGFKGTHADRSALVRQLSEIREVAQLGNVHTIQLAKSLAVAFPDAARASQALRGLREVSLVNDIRQPVEEVEPEIRMGWQFAAELESVPGIGLDLLDKVTDRPADPSETTRRADMTPAERRLTRAYLRAATDVARAGPRERRVDPGAIYGHGQINLSIAAARRALGPGAWPGRAGSATPPSIKLTLAEKALLAIPDALDPAITERHGCEFAVQMLRGGMPTDARRNVDGSVSEYHKVESRAAKTAGLHLDRALKAGTENPLKSILGRYVTHKGKSPFFAHDAVTSSQGLNKGFGFSHRGGTHEGRAIKDMIDVLEQALLKSGGSQNSALLDEQGCVDVQSLDDAMLQNLVRLAMLKTVKAKTILIPRYARADELSGPMLHAAHATVMNMVRGLEGADEAATNDLVQRVEEMLQRENVRLTPTALLNWAAAAGGPDSEAVLPEYENTLPGENMPDWSMFAKGFGRSTGREPPAVRTPALAGSTRADAADMFAEMISGEELGSGFSLSNLGTSHITTRNISEIMTALVTKGTASVRLDIGGGKRRMVTFESGVSADCSFLRMGVATVKIGQLGGGASIGPSLGVRGAAGFSLSVGGDIQYNLEILEQEGATFNFPRHLTGGLGGDRDVAQKKAQLLRLLIDVAGSGQGQGELARPGNPEDQHSLVKAAYQAFGDVISVGGFQVKQTDHRVTGGASVGVGASISAAGVSVGMPSLRNNGQVKVGSIEYKDTSGTLRVTKQTESVIFKAAADASIGSFAALIPGSSNDPQAFSEAVAAGVRPDLQTFTGVGTGSLASVSADYLKCGRTNAVNRTQDDDKQLSTSYAISTFNDPASFIHALAADYKTFAEDKARKYAAADYRDHPQATVDKEARLLGEYAGKVLEDKDLTALPQLYWEFGDDVSAVNQLMAEEYLSRRLGDKRRAQEAERQLDALHADPSWREARFISTANVASSSESKGMNGLLGLTHNIENRVSERVLGFT